MAKKSLVSREIRTRLGGLFYRDFLKDHGTIDNVLLAELPLYQLAELRLLETFLQRLLKDDLSPAERAAALEEAGCSVIPEDPEQVLGLIDVILQYVEEEIARR